MFITRMMKRVSLISFLCSLAAPWHVAAEASQADTTCRDVDATVLRAASPLYLAANTDLASVHAEPTQEMSFLIKHGVVRHPGLRAALCQAQVVWRRERHQCAQDQDCMNKVDASALMQLRSLAGQPADGVDRRAGQELRHAVARVRDPEWAVNEVLRRFRIGGPQVTHFGNRHSEDGSIFPTTRPKGVLRGEWLALRKSAYVPEGENGMGSYTLVDLDGDGHRDLIVNTYSGGTGLYNIISVHRWVNARFAGFGTANANGDAEFLYTTNGRGANQRVEWVRLQGRVYATYVDGRYGTDSISLLRPFEMNDRVIGFSVNYHYRLQPPAATQTAPLVATQTAPPGPGELTH